MAAKVTVDGVPRYRRVPLALTSRHSSKVHVVVMGVTAHDLAQGTPGRWPWAFPNTNPEGITEQATEEQWQANPCILCRDALEGKPLSGNA